MEVSVFLGCPSPGPLVARSGFCQVFFVCAYFCFQIANFSGIQSGMYEAEKKPRELIMCPSLGPKVLGWPAFSPPFRIYLFISYLMSRFLSVLNGKNREKFVYSIFTKVEVPGGDFF